MDDSSVAKKKRSDQDGQRWVDGRGGAGRGSNQGSGGSLSRSDRESWKKYPSNLLKGDGSADGSGRSKEVDDEVNNPLKKLTQQLLKGNPKKLDFDMAAAANGSEGESLRMQRWSQCQSEKKEIRWGPRCSLHAVKPRPWCLALREMVL
jgi:hypothetical protein